MSKYLKIAEPGPIRSQGVTPSFLLLYKMVDITDIFVFSLVHLDGDRSCVEFLLRPSVELITVIPIEPLTSASSKLRWIFGMRCSTL